MITCLVHSYNKNYKSKPNEVGVKQTIIVLFKRIRAGTQQTCLLPQIFISYISLGKKRGRQLTVSSDLSDLNSDGEEDEPIKPAKKRKRIRIQPLDSDDSDTENKGKTHHRDHCKFCGYIVCILNSTFEQ